MSPLTLLLVIVAAFAHAGWNLASKRASSTGVPFIWLGAVASTVVYLPVAGVDAFLSPSPIGAVVLGAFVSAVLHVGYMLLLQAGYARGDISVVYPMARGTAPLLSVVFAIVVFHEEPTLLGVIGALLVVAGVVGIGLSGRRGEAMPGATTAASPAPSPVLPRRTGLGPRQRAGVLFGLATGVSIAIYTVWDAYVVGELGASPILLMVGCTIGESIMLAPFAWRRRAEVRQVWRRYQPQVWTLGVLSPLSYILVLYALTLAPVSLVAPAREMSVVLVSLAGWLLLKEPDPLRRLGGAVVVLGGVALLAVA
ncbi:EamA family transporter [Plantibacter sp. YIM 135347]|uniref:EamA family transporter n=1 Tax=Plantibacter sp. YIM 135347 TaxID=3423919 RepID=UPI003D32B7BA